MPGVPEHYLLPHAEVRWSSDGRPMSDECEDFYYGADDGIAEKRHVFLELNRLRERWSQLPPDRHGHYTIFELGFGIGLNFLLTCELWRESAPASWELHYLSVEHAPMSPGDWQRALEVAHPPPERDRLLRICPPPVTGFHRRRWSRNVALTLLYLDVHDALEQVEGPVDTWYLDGFRPDRNRRMWDRHVCTHLFRLSRVGATLSTYSAAGWVRRELERAGFEVDKRTGFGRKKELMTALKPGRWTPQQRRHLDTIAIVGGGLAGTTAAAAFSERGIEVTLFESSARPLAGASGMHQLAYYPQLSAKPNWESHHSLAANLYLRDYLTHLETRSPIARGDCGLLRLATSVRDASRTAALERQFANRNPIAGGVDIQETRHVAGVDLPRGGLFYRTGGWVDPVTLAAAQLADGGIQVRTDTRVDMVACTESRQISYGTDGKALWSGDAVVFACSDDVRRFDPFERIPLQVVRGQTAHLPAEGTLAALRCIVSGAVSLFPAHEGICNVAATFGPNDEALEWRATEEAKLLNEVAAMLPGVSLPTPRGGNTGLRCVAQDRVPLVGILADRERMARHYDALRYNARAAVPPYPDPWTGLLTVTAFGAHGLNQIPLACEHLVALSLGEPAPVPSAVTSLLDPGRFLLRDLRRQRPAP